MPMSSYLIFCSQFIFCPLAGRQQPSALIKALDIRFILFLKSLLKDPTSFRTQADNRFHLHLHLFIIRYTSSIEKKIDYTVLFLQ